jgi:VanZ family protein
LRRTVLGANRLRKETSVLRIWLPVVLWTMVIAMESFFGSSGNTGQLLEGTLTWLFGQMDPVILDRLHFVLRKGGHFLGYGIFGYLWLRAFSATYPNGTRIIWAGLAIACTFLIASLDEWHQSFSTARTGHFADVALDTCGALLLVSMAMVAIRRHR